MLYLTFAWLCSKSLSGVQVLFGVDATDLASTLPQAAGHRYTVGFQIISDVWNDIVSTDSASLFCRFSILRIPLDSLAQEVRERPFDRIIFQFPQHKERNKARRNLVSERGEDFGNVSPSLTDVIRDVAPSFWVVGLCMFNVI